MSAKANRIWFELELDPDQEVCDTRAKLATNILRKIGDSISVFWYNRTKGGYCLTLDEAGGFVELEDNGHWFNLDHLGRDLG